MSQEIDGLIEQLFVSTPLPFVKEFLRSQKAKSKNVRIGMNRKEMKQNLRDALVGRFISEQALKKWLVEVEGWGKQHLYLATVPKRSLTQAHLLNSRALRRYLEKNDLLHERGEVTDDDGSYVIDSIEVDDEVARIVWRCHAIQYERQESLDETRELDDGDYVFRAFRMTPRRSASKCIIRKTDGVVLTLVDLPLGSEHTEVHELITKTARKVLAPLTLEVVRLGAIVTQLDGDAIRARGPRANRNVSLGVSPTQARFRADGARLEFKSTRESTGYTDCDAVRSVRRAMTVEQFEGEAGKFRLSFEGRDGSHHDMVVSLSAAEDRIFLFSRMKESELLALVDQLLVVRQSQN